MVEYTIKSPRGDVDFTLGVCDGGTAMFSVRFRSRSVIESASLGFELENGARVERFTAASARTWANEGEWTDDFGENKRVRDDYTALLAQLSSTDGYQLEVEARAYDCGAAFHLTLRRSDGRQIRLKNELTQFRFADDAAGWCAEWAQGPYSKLKISDMTGVYERPMTLETNGLYAAVGEAGLIDFARMRLRHTGDNTLVSALSAKPLYFFGDEAVLRDADETQLLKIEGGVIATPWRVVLTADSPAELYNANTLFKTLCPPCAIADTSFIKAGKVIRVAPITTENGIACVDFAAAHGLSYIEYDAGWYGPEGSFDSDARSVSVDPKRYAGPLDLAAVIAYAKERGIGVILYINQRAIMTQLDELLPIYKSWGVAGLKYGFVEVGPAKWTRWLYDCVRKAADYGMVLTIHDEFRPTGWSRTYPNLLTQEGVRGDEEKQPPENTLATVFNRMLCGAADNTVCYCNERVGALWSHGFQLAKALIIHSPLEFLYWYDNPCMIGDWPELEFFDTLPTVWDETRMLDGEIGSFALMARRSGDRWFAAAMNAGHRRDITLDCAFLDDGEYDALIFEDDPKYPTDTHVRPRHENALNAADKLTFNLLAPAGFVVIFVKRCNL